MKKEKNLEKKIWKLLLVVARRQMASSRLAYVASSLGLSKMERNALAQKFEKKEKKIEEKKSKELMHN